VASSWVPLIETVMVPLAVVTLTWLVAFCSGTAMFAVESQCSRSGVVVEVGPSLMPTKLLEGLTEFLYSSSATPRPGIPEKPRPPPSEPSEVGSAPRLASPKTSASRRRVNPVNLLPSEIRVLGCLLEKQRTTPDAYPLSLNALRLACNQSTNRNPIVDYDEALVRDALHRLERRGFTRLASGAGSRAAKYRHLLEEALPMEPGEQALMCALMLRGPQTPGELKQRTERMHVFAELSAVGATLERLIERELVLREDRRPGQKEERYTQLLGQEEDAEEEGEEIVVADPAGTRELVDLTERVSRLEAEVDQLRAAMRDPSSQQLR
jgi:uncharacterized protein